MSKYKASWVEWAFNEDFWREVLVGRTITAVSFDDKGISSFTLDNDEVVFLDVKSGSRLYIND